MHELRQDRAHLVSPRRSYAPPSPRFQLALHRGKMTGDVRANDLKCLDPLDFRRTVNK